MRAKQSRNNVESHIDQTLNIQNKLVAGILSAIVLIGGYQVVKPSDLSQLTDSIRQTREVQSQEIAVLQEQGRALANLSENVERLRKDIDANTKLGLEILASMARKIK